MASELGKWTKFTVYLPFVDEMVDRESIAWDFVDRPVVLVETDDEVIAQIREMFNEYSVPISAARSLNDVLEILNSVSLKEKKTVLIVNEELCSNESLIELNDAGRPVLVTYGSRFIIEKSDVHFRSILQTLPSVVMSRILNSSRAVAPVTATTATPVPAENEVDLTSLRVLIAEDNLVNQKVLKRLLAKLGVTHVDIAGNGQIAVDKEAATAFDVVFMDAQMPIMDGVEACRRICQRERSVENREVTPSVVFVTAQVLQAFQDECKAAGATSFLAKPCTVTSVGKCLKRICGETVTS